MSVGGKTLPNLVDASLPLDGTEELFVNQGGQPRKVAASDVAALAPGGGGDVLSVFGRDDVVVAEAGDYTSAQISYDPTISGLAATDVKAAIDLLAASEGGEGEALGQNLTEIKNLTFAANDFIQYKGGVLTNRTPLEVAADLEVIAAEFANPSTLVYVNQIYPAGVVPGSRTGSTAATAIKPTDVINPDTSLPYDDIADYIAHLPAQFRDSATSWPEYWVPALTDTCDYIALQTATNYVYDSQPFVSDNFGTGSLVLDAKYTVNRTVVFNHAAIRVAGVNPSVSRFRAGAQASVEYNGPAGTEDDPIAMFHFYLQDEFDLPPPGRFGNNALSGGMKVEILDVAFVGNGFGNTTKGASNFITGVRVGKAQFCQIKGVQFGSGLYDGVFFSAPGLWLILERNFFYGCHRDSISIANCTGNFTTTVWIFRNEFGSGGRYGILLDLSGSIEAMPIIHNNSFEFASSNSFYVNNPEYYVHGLVAANCYINCGNLVDEGNRYEGMTSNLHSMWADIHLISGAKMTLENGIFKHPFFTLHAAAGGARTPAAIRYQDDTKIITAITQADPAVVTTSTPHGYFNGQEIHVFGMGSFSMIQANGKHTVANITSTTFELEGVDSTGFNAYVANGRATGGRFYQDITNLRNYRVASTGDFPSTGLPSNLTIRNIYNMSRILGADANCLGNTSSQAHNFENIEFSFGIVPTMAAATQKTITGITKADPAVVTCVGHGYANGTKIAIAGVVGMTQVNGHEYFVANADTDTFELQGINSTDYLDYVSGGYAVDGIDGRKVTPIEEALVLPSAGPGNVVLTRCRRNSSLYGHYNDNTDSGDRTLIGDFISTWAAETAYFATPKPTPPGMFGSRGLVKPTTFNGFSYQVVAPIEGGTSGSSEPSWPLTVGQEVADGDLTWRCISGVFPTDQTNSIEQIRLGKRIKQATAAPTTGRWSVGDRVYAQSPSAGGTEGWVCTTAGLPGTWKTFGTIQA